MPCRTTGHSLRALQEADPAGISRLLCDRVLGLIVRLCLRYDLNGTEAATVGSESDEHVFSRVVTFYDGYSSSFHTKDVLVRKLIHYFDAWLPFARDHLQSGAVSATSLGADAAEEQSTQATEDATLAQLKRNVDALSALDLGQLQQQHLLFAVDPRPEQQQREDDERGKQALQRAQASGLLRLPTLFLPSFEMAAIVQLRMIVSLSARVISKVCLPSPSCG
jgi:hypothetical protein